MIKMKTPIKRQMWSLIPLKHQHFYILQAFIMIIKIQDVLKTSKPLSPPCLSSTDSSG